MNEPGTQRFTSFPLQVP